MLVWIVFSTITYFVPLRQGATEYRVQMTEYR